MPTLSTPTTRFSGSVAPQRSRDTYLKHIYLLDVRIDEINKTTALEKAAEFLQGTKSKKIFTPNPEMLVKAHADLYFKKVLNGGDLNLCDGMGLVIASGFKLKRIPGVDFMLELCALAEKNNKSIFLLGSRKEEVLTNTATKLLQRFPKLKIAGYCNGPEVAENNITMKQYNNETNLLVDPAEQQKTTDLINSTRPDIVFVAFGMGKQEKWIDQNLAELPSVTIAMGVGGSFDFISGRIKRAPLLLRRLGLEWLYRLWQEPKRLARIFNATVHFLYLVIKN